MSDVDTSITRDVVDRLAVRSTREDAIRDIIATPAKYAPPALYAVASAMFSDGKRDESLFWFYLGQLRARSDANKCKDGMGAFLGDSDTFFDKSKREEIDESTRAEYEKGLEQGLAQFLKLKAELDTNGDGVITDEERKAHEEKEIARIREETEEAMKELEIEKPK